jgi:uncharacterized protein
MEALSSVEIRVLATLIEKEITTPDYYPMTLNALTNACNQKTNREPITALDESEVTAAFEIATKQGLARFVDEGASRVAKYRQRLIEQLKLTPAQTAILCELMLRGAQTLGELKGRADRMYSFPSLADVEITLSQLAAHTHDGSPKPLVMRLPRQAGQKEARFTHLLAGTPDLTALADDSQSKHNNERNNENNSERIAQLERDVATLNADLSELRSTFEAFRRQGE